MVELIDIYRSLKAAIFDRYVMLHNWVAIKSLRHKWLRFLVVEDEPDWSKYE